VKLEDALRLCGVEIDKFPDARKEQKNAAAYLELHIEQGPVLERMGLSLGVVLGTKGVERHIVTFHGQEAHSGSTPMNARRDALAAAAKLALEIRTIARKHEDAVCTMGSVKTFPGIVTAVVGRCEVTLDQRDLDARVLAQMYREAQEASYTFAAEENCTVTWSRLWDIEPVPFHPHLLDLCEQAVRETSGSSHRMPSGPLHDAAEVSRAGIPTVMMFVQSLGGISHNKIEDTKEEHLEMSVVALDRLASKTVDWILKQR
jgi:N-carbamoyl-L-amino-acid hydrolase